MRALKLGACFAIVAIIAIPLVARHAAAGILDEDVYQMIDDLVEGTPHADWTPPTSSGGMTETVIDTQTLQSVENMIDDGLLTYAAMLDGDVAVLITYGHGADIELTIYQAN